VAHRVWTIAEATSLVLGQTMVGVIGGLGLIHGDVEAG